MTQCKETDRTTRARPPVVVLTILDGLGERAETEGNAVALAKTPTLDRLRATCPTATLRTCGPDVGLPEGQMGNSEVGHTNIGAGRIVWMDLPRIDKAIAENDFATRDAFRAHVDALGRSGGTAHIAGILSGGGVHGHQRHLAQAARAIAKAGTPVCLHLFTDGRDVAPRSALGYLDMLEADLAGASGIRIATLTGRYYALDRDRRWERIEKAWQAMARGEGETSGTARAAIEAGYARGETDEFILPTVLDGFDGIANGDGLFFTNYRTDRAKQILAALIAPDFDRFPRERTDFADVLGMVRYSDGLAPFMNALFEKETVDGTLGQTVAEAGRTQFRLAETEKYPHVTFFLNGGAEAVYPGETRHMAPSPKVATYDKAPEMAAAEVTEQLTGAIRSGDHDLIVVNFANPDMVGHSGVLEAAIAAVEATDAGLGDAVTALHEVGGRMLVIADHGNCEMMIDPETGGPHTAHTLNDVPVILVGDDRPLREGGRLGDVAPTLLHLMGIDPPPEMTGRCLLETDATQSART